MASRAAAMPMARCGQEVRMPSPRFCAGTTARGAMDPRLTQWRYPARQAGAGVCVIRTRGRTLSLVQGPRRTADLTLRCPFASFGRPAGYCRQCGCQVACERSWQSPGIRVSVAMLSAAQRLPGGDAPAHAETVVLTVSCATPSARYCHPASRHMSGSRTPRASMTLRRATTVSRSPGLRRVNSGHSVSRSTTCAPSAASVMVEA